MAPKYKDITAFDPYESRYELSVIGDKLAELEKEQSQRIEATTNIVGDLYSMWGEQQTFDTNKMLDMKAKSGEKLYEKTTNTFQDLYTPSGGRVALTKEGKHLEGLGESGLDLKEFGIVPEGFKGSDIGATNILDQTKEGAKSITATTAGSKALNIGGKVLGGLGILKGISEQDPYSTVGGIASFFNPLVGLGISALGMFDNSRKRKGSWF